MEKETIMIDGVRYYADRPRSCRGCFFWKNRKAGCSLKKENCYYLAESPKKNSPCKGCCYAPCVSFCMKKCMNEVNPEDMCYACFNKAYPIEDGEKPAGNSKYVFEHPKC